MPFTPPEQDRASAFEPPAPDRAPAQGSAFQDVTETIARGMVRGIPIVGPSIESGIEHAQSYLEGKPLPEVQARGQQLQTEHSVLNTGAEIAGSVAGTAPLVAAAPTLFGVGRGSLFVRSVLGAGSGAALGAADVGARGGEPLTGAAFGAAGGAAGALIGGALGRAFAKRAATPTAQALKEQGGALFDRARAAGLTVKADPYRAAVDRLATGLAREGLDPILHPKAARVLVRLQEAAKADQLDLADLDTLRRLAGVAAGSVEEGERRIGQLMIEQLDTFMSKLGAAQVTAGDPKAVNAILKEARHLWHRASKVDLIEGAVDRARLMSAGGTQSEAAALRVQFRGLARDKRLMRTFSAEEQKAIREVVEAPTLPRMLERVGSIRNSAVGGALGAAGGAFLDLGIPGLGTAGGVAAGATAARSIGALGRELGDVATVRAAERAGALAAGLRPMTPSARARAFGSAFALGTGLEVGLGFQRRHRAAAVKLRGCLGGLTLPCSIFTYSKTVCPTMLFPCHVSF